MMEYPNAISTTRDNIDRNARRGSLLMPGALRYADFFRGVGALLGGTILAQLIPLLALPLLSRLYSPQSFAVLALVMMVASLTGPASTGYYEQAAATPRNARRAQALMMVAYGLAAISTILLAMLLWLFHQRIAEVFSLTPDGVWRLAIPAALLFGSSANIANYWLLRVGRHGLQSTVKLTHAIVNMSLALAFGYMHNGEGLLIAFTVAVAASALWGGGVAYANGLRLRVRPLKRYILPLMAHYRDFPLFGSLPATMNNLALQCPLIIITATYSLTVAGHFSIIRNLLNGGLILVSACIGQVLLRQLVTRRHASQPLWPVVRNALLVLAGLGMAGGSVVYAAAPAFVALYLGAGWEDSGLILRTLSISSPLILMGASLAPALIAIGRIRIMGLWQLFYLVVSLGLLLVVSLPFQQFLGLLVAMECAVYGLYIVLICSHVRRFDAARAAGK